MQAIFQRAYEWRQRPGFAIACEWLRRYVFAIACVVAPIVLGYFTFNYAVHRIIPRTTEGLSFVYEAAKPISQAIPAPPQHSAPDTSAAAKTETAIAAPDSKIYLLGVTVAGRFNYAVASGFIYLVSAGAIAFGIGVIVITKQWIIGAIGIATLSYLPWAMGGSHRMPTPYDLGRPLLIDSLLDQADSFEALSPLATQKTGEKVAALVGFNTLVALTAVMAILISLFILSTRPNVCKLNKVDLQSRLAAIRWALLLSSALLVTGVLASKVLLQWPLSLISDAQAAALQPIANALTLELGATGTFVLFAAYSPAVAAWMLDVACWRAREAESAKTSQPSAAVPAVVAADKGRSSDSDDGLDFAPLSWMSSILGILAPILASPFVDSLKAVLGSLPH
jgi:hypothetical protein